MDCAGATPASCGLSCMSGFPAPLLTLGSAETDEDRIRNPLRAVLPRRRPALCADSYPTSCRSAHARLRTRTRESVASWSRSSRSDPTTRKSRPNAPTQCQGSNSPFEALRVDACAQDLSSGRQLRTRCKHDQAGLVVVYNNVLFVRYSPAITMCLRPCTGGSPCA